MSFIFNVHDIPKSALPFAEDLYTFRNTNWKSFPRECFFKGEIPEHYGYEFWSLLRHATLKHQDLLSETFKLFVYTYLCYLIFLLLVRAYSTSENGDITTLGSTQPVTEMSARGVVWGEGGGRCVGMTTLPPLCANCPEILGALRACSALYRDS